MANADPASIPLITRRELEGGASRMQGIGPELRGVLAAPDTAIGFFNTVELVCVAIKVGEVKDF